LSRGAQKLRGAIERGRENRKVHAPLIFSGLLFARCFAAFSLPLTLKHSDFSFAQTCTDLHSNPLENLLPRFKAERKVTPD
jgi:hypothetical protein